jgi:hypothetical protein
MERRRSRVSVVAFLIRIHLRRVLLRAHLLLEINLRRAIRVYVTDLIAGWDHYGTNRRPITMKSETRFNIARRRFDFRLGPL